MKNIVMVFILFFSTFAWSQATTTFKSLPRSEEYRIKSIERLKKEYSNYVKELSITRVNGSVFNAEDLGAQILLFEVAEKEGTVVDVKKMHEIMLDHLKYQCEVRLRKYDCSLIPDKMKNYKDKYKAEYDPQKIVYPTFDTDKMTYTMPNGLVYDLNKGAVVNTAPQPKAPTQVAIPASSDPTKVEEKKVEAPTEQVQYDDTETSKNSEDKTCVWDDSKSKRSLSGLGCEEKVCSSWVICTKNGRKSRSLASCSMDLCVDGKATECVAQKGYGSIKLNFKNTTASGTKAPANKQKTQN